MGCGLRSARERVVQTLSFELIGLLLMAPLYAVVADAGMRESFAMVAVVSMVVMTWSAIFNSCFDVIEPGYENSTTRHCPVLILRCRAWIISRQVAFYLGKLVLSG